MKKNKSLLVILISGIFAINVLVLSLIIVAHIYSNKNASDNNNNNTNAQTMGVMPVVPEGYVEVKTLKVKNSSDLLATGLDNKLIIKILDNSKNYITKFLPNLYNNVNNNIEMNENFYSQVQEEIQEYAFISSYEDFSTLINTIKNSGIDYNEYTELELVNFEKQNGINNLKFKVYYEQGDEVTMNISCTASRIRSIVIEH